MRQADLFWKLDGLSDGAVLGGLQGLVGSGRRVLAALLAHLGEVEERRLHLAAGHGSMFVYCVSKLCLSEDEAYRRIEVARLARRFPALFPLLADGRISLSVVAVLKPHITPANMDELTQLVCGASVQRARELLAARFPRPDVPSTIRKLPDRRRQPLERLGGTLPGVLESAAPPTHSAEMAECAQSSPGTEPCVPGRHHVAINDGPPSSSSTPAVMEAAPPAAPCSSPPRPASHRALVPLAEGRYKVQFTADAELKHKLELARDLMRHSLPGGDMATILARALDLLVERLMKRRFGVGAKRSQSRRRKGATQESAAQPSGGSAPSPPSDPTQSRRRKAATQEAAIQPSADSALPPPSVPSPDVTRATRRAVLERDGLRCIFRARMAPSATRGPGSRMTTSNHAHMEVMAEQRTFESSVGRTTSWPRNAPLDVPTSNARSVDAELQPSGLLASPPGGQGLSLRVRVVSRLTSIAAGSKHGQPKRAALDLAATRKKRLRSRRTSATSSRRTRAR